MSGTPRTDARVRMIIDNDGSAEGLEIFARELERELTDAKHRIRTLIEERDSARIRADRKWKLREEFEALLGTDDVATGVERVKEAKRGAARYEVVRKMTSDDFRKLYLRCLFEDLRFDDEVDKIGGLK